MIPLALPTAHSQECVKTRLDYDPETGIFRWRARPVRDTHRRHDLTWNTRYAGTIAGEPHTKGYLRIGFDRKRYFAHRLAWFYVHGEWPPEQIDHRDRNRTNNAIANLRLSSPTRNLGNTGMFKHNTSGIKGVHWTARERRWVAQIQMGGKNVRLGYFKNRDDARDARLAAAVDHFGEFAAEVADQ